MKFSLNHILKTIESTTYEPYMSMGVSTDLIVCTDMNNMIGIENKLVIRSKKDLNFFKEMTTGNVILMGRKTFESIGRILPNRLHLVLSKSGKLNGYQLDKAVQFTMNTNAASFVYSISLYRSITNEDDYVFVSNDYNILKAFAKLISYTHNNKTFFVIGGKKVYGIALASNINKIYINKFMKTTVGNIKFKYNPNNFLLTKIKDGLWCEDEQCYFVMMEFTNKTDDSIRKGVWPIYSDSNKISPQPEVALGHTVDVSNPDTIVITHPTDNVVTTYSKSNDTFVKQEQCK